MVVKEMIEIDGGGDDDEDGDYNLDGGDVEVFKSYNRYELLRQCHYTFFNVSKWI
jgi:hypothetical protein